MNVNILVFLMRSSDGCQRILDMMFSFVKIDVFDGHPENQVTRKEWHLLEIKAHLITGI
jgi:hypothetical protein